MPVFSNADTLRPGFSLAMEVLASIPPSPSHVTMESLVKDFGLGNQPTLQTFIRQLKDIGFDVQVTNRTRGKGGNKGRVVFINQAGWRHAETAAENYWQTVWGDQKHTAQDLGGPPAATGAAA